MTISENIFLGREKCRGPWLNKKEMITESRRLLDEIGLDIDVTRNLGSFPLSIQQMVEICKALAFDCRIIVMDEPTSALTDVEVEKLFAIVDKLKKSGCGIIYISHKMEEIYRIADRITVLRDGAYVGTATAKELDRDKMVKWMVGRELNQQFPRHKSAPGQVRLKVNSFTLPDPAGKPMPAVNNVSFSVRGGEILGHSRTSGVWKQRAVKRHFRNVRKQSTRQIVNSTASHTSQQHLRTLSTGNLTADKRPQGQRIGFRNEYRSQCNACRTEKILASRLVKTKQRK